MGFCIPKAQAAALIQEIGKQKMTPEDLIDLGTEGRRAFFGKFVGEDVAHEVNLLFESKVVLKDQQRGMINWAKKLVKSGELPEAVGVHFIQKVGKLENILSAPDEKSFLADLAAKKLGFGVTQPEAAQIVKESKQITELRSAYNPETQTWASENARLQYGTAFEMHQRYVGDLMAKANALTPAEYLEHPWKFTVAMAGATKGIVASMDMSFSLRQGFKMAVTHPGLWTKGFLEQWKAAGRELAGGDGMLAIKADVASRPNALNGKYSNTKVVLNLKFEEAMPSNLPERIPLFGRLYKASEAAYNGMALRLRADYADKMIAAAERYGVDMSRPSKQAEGIGALVNSMTGRGGLGRLEAFGEATNAAFFSVKFLKSNFDVLTMHRGGLAIEKGPARSFVRREAAKNLAKIVGTTAAILFTAEQLWPDSVEWDSRSANFGKIKIGNTRFDITGGMGSIVVLASRIVPTIHNGQLRWGWSKSGMSGKWTDLTAGKYGQSTALDVVDNFWQGKLAPGMGIIRDRLAGETYGGGPLTPKTVALNLVEPMGLQTFIEAMNDSNHANLLAVVILDGLGVSTNTYSAQSAKLQRRQAAIERRKTNQAIDEVVRTMTP